MKFLLIIGVLSIVLADVTIEVNGQGEDGGMCAWIKQHTGWGCDDPVSIAAWKTYLATFYGIHNCNDLCVKKIGRNGGSCKAGSVDNSSWCPKGQSCQCY
jgi:hypothetical protein